MGRSNEERTYAEFLAFGDGYWLDAFVTEWKAPVTESIVTIWFTPHCPDRHAIPPPDEENLLSIDLFNE